MSIKKEIELKFIDESDVPGRGNRKTEEWIAILKKIPKGKALVATEKDLGVNGGSVKALVNRCMRQGLIPKEYAVRQRSKGNVITVYVIHQSEPLQSEKPDKVRV